uniref:Bromo domain-containing protein n=1 Tax=Chaetoceros debilis TaxID=122233 RepID=A0A7S3Q5X7_9STRA
MNATGEIDALRNSTTPSPSSASDSSSLLLLENRIGLNNYNLRLPNIDVKDKESAPPTHSKEPKIPLNHSNGITASSSVDEKGEDNGKRCTPKPSSPRLSVSPDADKEILPLADTLIISSSVDSRIEDRRVGTIINDDEKHTTDSSITVTNFKKRQASAMENCQAHNEKEEQEPSSKCRPVRPLRTKDDQPVEDEIEEIPIPTSNRRERIPRKVKGKGVDVYNPSKEEPAEKSESPTPLHLRLRSRRIKSGKHIMTMKTEDCNDGEDKEEPRGTTQRSIGEPRLTRKPRNRGYSRVTQTSHNTKAEISPPNRRRSRSRTAELAKAQTEKMDDDFNKSIQVQTIRRRRGRSGSVRQDEEVAETANQRRPSRPTGRRRRSDPSRSSSPSLSTTTTNISTKTSLANNLTIEPSSKRRNELISTAYANVRASSTLASTVLPTRKSPRPPQPKSLEIRNSLHCSKSHSPISNPDDHHDSHSTSRSRSRSRSGSFFTHPHEHTHFKWQTEMLFDLLISVERKTDLYGFFSKPVNPDLDECPDYYDVVDINDAMCFDTMRKMIARAGSGETNDVITSIQEFKSCLNRIIKCARDYNTDEENFVRKQADLIEKRSDGIIMAMSLKWADHEKAIKEMQEKLKQEKGAREREAAKAKADEETKAEEESKAKAEKARRVAEKSNMAEEKALVPKKRGRPRKNSDDDEYEGDLKSKSAPRSRGIHKRQSSRRSVHDDGDGDGDGDDDSKGPSRRKRKRKTTYSLDNDSLGSLSESDLLPKKDDDYDSDIDHDAPIIGSGIPFCKPMLAGSTMTPCNKREDWLELCPLLARVCNEAARRSTLRKHPGAKRYEKPLSEIYIKERLEYDTPLDGYVVKTVADPQHLQGFIVTTQFTTWRKTFRWTMDTPAAMITPTDHRLHLTDRDGSLVKDLQEAVREGDSSETGFKYPRICEVSLLGGLGCGGGLLSRALSELRQLDKYDFVVMQSTKIAIPFYEKHGFIRVGAVTRFNDKEVLPEVAYRHWSEIVDGEAVEPSYMMARRLNSKGIAMPETMPIIRDATEEQRKAEIQCALKSAYELLSNALTVRIGSSAYVNSFREVLSAAREFALSADDYHLVKLIDKSLSEFTGSHFGKSKVLLRRELRNGRIETDDFVEKDMPGEMDDSLKQDEFEESSRNHDSKGISQSERSITTTPTFATANVKIIQDNAIVPNEDDEDSDDDEADVHGATSSAVATIPLDFFTCDDADFSVKIVMPEEDEDSVEEEESISEKDEDEIEEEEALFARDLAARLPVELKARRELITATDLAVQNLRSFVVSHASVKKEKVDGPGQVGMCDEIMIRIKSPDGTSFWADATVIKSCKIQKVTPHYTGRNGYFVEWEDNGRVKKEKRVLDPRNRGVGKLWCTEMDYASFAVLPTNLLDLLLIGSSVHYSDTKGKTVIGCVTKRVGGGLSRESSWRVEKGRDPRKKGRPLKGVTYEYENLTAAALREVIIITDSNTVKVRKLLKEDDKFKKKSASMDDGDKKMKCTDESKHRCKKTFVQSAEGWASFRLEEYNLLKISEDEKMRRKKIVCKIDDAIIHLSTGIGGVCKKVREIHQTLENPIAAVKREREETEQAPTSSIDTSGESPSSDLSNVKIKTSSGVEESIVEPPKKRRRVTSTNAANVRRSSRNRIP